MNLSPKHPNITRVRLDGKPSSHGYGNEVVLDPRKVIVSDTRFPLDSRQSYALVSDHFTPEGQLPPPMVVYNEIHPRDKISNAALIGYLNTFWKTGGPSTHTADLSTQPEPEFDHNSLGPSK